MRLHPLVVLSIRCVAASVCIASSASADHVVLIDGAVIEGKATRQGGKVLIEMGAGQVTLDAELVVRIEDAESDVEKFEARVKALKPRDVNGALNLANFCRDHDLRAQEIEMLRRVIEISPNHEEARTRLGYVKGAHGYVTFAEAQREKGLVLREGRWMTREQALELDRLTAETKKAELAREREQLAVESQRVELERQRERRDREKAESARPESNEAQGYPVWFGTSTCANGTCGSLTPPNGGPNRFINGARDPRDTSFSMPGVRDPRSYF